MIEPTQKLPRRRRRIAPGINVAPLLDVIMNLIFFFMLATSVRNQQSAMNVSLPSSASAQPTESKAKPMVVLNVGGKIFFNNEERTKDALAAEMKSLIKTNVDEISIHADKGVEFGRVIEVMDVCKLAGMRAVTLDAEKKKE